MDMIDLQESTNGMVELMYGDKTPDLIHALRVAALSPLQSLEANGRMSRLLAPYVGKRLPERDVLFELLRIAKGVLYGSHVNALLAIDEAWEAGLLDRFTYVPCDYEGQVRWRQGIVDTLKGVGLKVASFALLIFSPLSCQLIPVDRHHLRRLGMDINKTPKGKKYLAIELGILAERNANGYASVPLGIYAAHLWGIARNGVEADVYPSHRALSCRWY